MKENENINNTNKNANRQYIEKITNEHYTSK